MFPILNDATWQSYYEFLEVRGAPFFEPFYHEDTVIEGYFQNSQPLNEHRARILKLFREDTRLHIPITQSGATIKDLLEAEPPIKLLPTDIVLHLRLGDYREANWVIDPAPQLAILRRLSAQRLIIICQAPKTDAERNYLRFFEEFHPIIQHGTELEDFATLRAANRILVSNSTFSWFAAWLGTATERWIPVPTFNELGAIDPTDHLYGAANGYDMSGIDIPIELLPVTGEYLQSLCDYTVLDKKKKLEFHHWIDAVAPRQLFIEEEWDTDAKSLFVYPEPGLLEAVVAHPWHSLRLLVIGNGDNQANYDVLLPFLNTNPTVRAWVQNNTVPHPQIRSIPIAEQNRIWRGGSPTFEPPVTICRAAPREYGIIYPWCSETHPIRAVWNKEAKLLRARQDMEMFPRLPKEEYLEGLEAARTVVCPPGNGFDTHRHWESLYKGAWAIVKDNAHTACLLAEYPSLPLIPIASPSALATLELPTGPSPFHPMLLRPFWKTLFESYVV